LEDLTESEALFGQLDDPIGLQDPSDGSIVYANPAACRYAGCSLEEMRRKHVADFGFGASREETLVLSRELTARAREGPVAFDCAVRSLAGTVTQMHMKLQPVKIGRREFVMSIGREISSEDRPFCLVGPKLAAIELAGEGLGIIDAAGRVRYVNPAAAELFGYDSPDQLIGKQGGELIEDTDESRLAGDTLLRNNAWSGVLMARHKNGTRVPLSVRGWRTDGLIEEGGAFFVASISSLEGAASPEPSERARSAQMPANRSLERMAELGQLACTVVHDLNNYLTVILSYARLGMTLGDLDPMVQSYLRVIEGAANNASHIPDFLLGVARQEPGSITVVSLNKLIQQNKNLIEHVLTRKAEVSFELCPSECLARVDPVQMGQVLLNLASNARDAMGGGGHLVVGLRVIEPRDLPEPIAPRPPANDDSWASIWFQDEGCGMTGDVAERVFEPFFTTKPPGRGTGLGLPSVKRIVEDTGGQIALMSEIEQGTRVDVYLPLVEVV